MHDPLIDALERSLAARAAAGLGRRRRVVGSREGPRAVVDGRELVSFAPDLVGTTSMTTDAYQAKAVLRVARAIRPEAACIRCRTVSVLTSFILRPFFAAATI
jgi:hypothetical protein